MRQISECLEDTNTNNLSQYLSPVRNETLFEIGRAQPLFISAAMIMFSPFYKYRLQCRLPNFKVIVARPTL